MALIAQDSGGNFKPVPPGNHVGRCYAIIDMGTQEGEYQGTPTIGRKVLIRWELFGEDENGQPLIVDDGKPMTISKSYTLTLGKKAKLRADLQAWRGREFTPEELKGFDIETVLGVYCMVNVTHSESAGKTYSNVSSLSPLPAMLRNNKPAPIHERLTFDVTNPNMEIFEEFHEKLRDKIRLCTEWQTRNANAGKSTNSGSHTGAGFDDMDDDIPFN